MSHALRAVIDVGTNSVKLLVADVAGREARPVFEGGSQTRLGEGLYVTRRLQAGAIARTVAAVGEYAARAHELGATSVGLFATSAAREAVNRQELAAAIGRACGLKLEIISGEQEAVWAFRGAQTNPGLAREPLLMVEVGGGSTQLILGQRDQIHFHESYPLGAVGLMERFPHSDPPKPGELMSCRAWLGKFLAKRVRPALVPALRQETQRHARHHAALLVGVGGTVTVLARMEQRMTDYDRERIEALRLSRKQVHAWTDRLWGQPLAARRRTIGLPPERADVILTGIAIYEAVMEQFDFSELRVSTRGLRFAAVMDTTQDTALTQR
jgi:exopolyphosphatase/guanosine-5'-triphosphate,3'-diphosphate pyrophosphatase